MVLHRVQSFGANKIMAIKLVRELAGCGLADAKRWVEEQVGFAVQTSPDQVARIVGEAREYGIEFEPSLEGHHGVGSTTATVTGVEPSAGQCSVRFVQGRSILAIKLVRELTGLGLLEAKTVVDQCGVVRTGLSESAAANIVQRFAELELEAEVVHGPSPKRAREQDEDYDF